MIRLFLLIKLQSHHPTAFFDKRSILGSSLTDFTYSFLLEKVQLNHFAELGKTLGEIHPK